MTTAAPADPRPWYGDGPPPWERWPGVSLVIDATWNADVVWTSPHARVHKTHEPIPQTGRWEIGDFYFDEPSAAHAVGFFPRYMRHTTGAFAGQPFVLLPWQEQLVIRPLFGWRRKSDGHRRFRTLFCEVAKKSGKTQLMSGLASLLAFADREPGAQVYAAAANDDQARILWDEAAKSIRACPEFLEDAGVEVFKSSIVQARTESMFKVISSTVGTKHGFNVHGLIIDEFHTQRSRDLYDTLYKGTSARRQPMTILITTAGDDRESICYEEHERALKIRDGIFEDAAYLPVVFQMADSDDWTSEAAWHKANPSLGVTKSIDYMRSECKAAQAEPRKRNSFLRLELNVWTESRMVWIAPEAWEACRRVGPIAEESRLVACAGLDLSTNTDLTALVVALRRPDRDERTPDQIAASAPGERALTLDYTVELIPFFWLPRDILRERSRQDRIPYDVWARDGWLRVTDGNVVDKGEIYRVLVEEIKPRFRALREVGFDPWCAADLAAAALAKGVPMIEVRQGFGSLSAPSKLLEALVLSNRIRHDGNPCLRWNIANTEVQSDPAGNIKPVKPGGDARGRRRIDGVVATITALSRLMVAPAASQSRYATMGLQVIG